MLAVEAYRRRRAWAAWHAGYGLHVKDPDFDDLMGRAAAPQAMPIEDILANIRRHRVAQGLGPAKPPAAD